jgi:uncharacterized membrane protein YidH (DUF202 family)
MLEPVAGNAVQPTPVDPRVGLAHHRTGLAGFRTQLALDRTTLAWIRTTLTMASFGFGMVGFFRTLHLQAQTPEAARMHAAAIQFGLGLIVLGIGATLAAALSHWLALRRLRNSQAPVVTQWPLSITAAVLLSVLGMYALWKLLAP